MVSGLQRHRVQMPLLVVWVGMALFGEKWIAGSKLAL
jgi:hypothetical protein